VVQRKALTLEKWQAAVQRQVGICAQHSTALGCGEGCTIWAHGVQVELMLTAVACITTWVGSCLRTGGGYRLTLLQAVCGNALHSIVAIHCTQC
jgi:hypothetical protein